MFLCKWNNVELQRKKDMRKNAKEKKKKEREGNEKEKIQCRNN
jgi:hypothetical protein